MMSLCFAFIGTLVESKTASNTLELVAWCATSSNWDMRKAWILC